MKPLILSTLIALTLASCVKPKSHQAPTATNDQYMTFSFLGDSAWVDVQVVDTSWSLPQNGYPQVMIYGIAYLPGAHDTMDVRFWLMDNMYLTGSVSSVTQFSGYYNSAQYYEGNADRFVKLQMDSEVTNDDFISMFQYNYNFSATVDSIRGRTMWGTFYGIMTEDINNNNMPLTENLSNGKFKVNLW